MNAITDTSRNVALELHALLRDLDPSRWRREIEAAVRRRIAEIERALARLLAEAQAAPPLSARLQELTVILSERVPRAGLPAGELEAAWARYRDELHQAYEALRAYLAGLRIDVPTLRPTNYTRSGFHVLMGITVLILLEHVVGPRGRWLAPGVVAATFWTLEGLRHKSARWRAFLLWIFRPIAHPHEQHRINSSTWLATALTILGFFFQPVACAAAVAVLGVADPAAAFVGRRWGRTRIVGDRSLEGTTTFVVIGTLAALAALSIWHSDVSLGSRFAMAGLAAIFGAVAELVSKRLDDNLTIPLAAACGAWVALVM